MKVRGHDGTWMQPRMHLRRAASVRWRKAYLRAWAVAFVGIALVGAWAHDGLVLVAALMSAGACWVWANLPRRWWE